jgi:hypothetical protein
VVSASFSIRLAARVAANPPLAADEQGKPQVDLWGGQDLNLRPTDYEFDPALSPTREIEPREPLTSGFSPQRTPTLRNVSQSVAGPMRDTSLAAHAEHRESQLLCIRTNERVGPPTHRPVGRENPRFAHTPAQESDNPPGPHSAPALRQRARRRGTGRGPLLGELARISEDT